MFAAYRWPGNIRQLENLMERLIVLSDGNEIKLNDLPEPIRATAVTDELIRIELPEQGLDLEAVEKELLTKALQKFSGNQSRAAAYLNISRKTFLHRLTKFGILKRSSLSLDAGVQTAEEAT